MRPRARILASASLSLCCWVIVSWPLARHVADAIPCSAHAPKSGGIRRMVPGDHLQLLYRFWLAGDMVSGRTPLFHDLYQFNAGDDSERFQPGAHYCPFSLVFALLSRAGGPAFGWNTTGLLVLFVTHLATWLLIRRYTPVEPVAALFATAAACMPFFWVAWMGGSPSGYAVVFVPLVLLGLDLAVRERCPWGGLLAGLGALMAAWSDMHVFMFTLLCAPCWCLVALLADEAFAWRQPRAWLGLLRPAVPVLVLALLAVAYVRLRVSFAVGPSLMHEGRRPEEVALYSPSWPDFLFASSGVGRLVYIGPILSALLALGVAMACADLLRNRRAAWRRPVTFLLLCAGLALIACLALGTNEPFGGWLFTLSRRLVPPYRMIRQPAKVFCLAPTLASVAGAMALDRLLCGVDRRALRAAALALFATFLLAGFRSQISPALCRLDRTQGAYAAVAGSMWLRASVSRALAVPLWPGDSASSSQYPYYASLYRIRMVNGYSPAVRRRYVDEVFIPYRSVNKGVLTETQIAGLIERGVGFILLHEDVFPEKVSPFSAAFTLRNLLNHPRLRLLRQDGAVWAFEILGAPQARAPRADSWQIFSPARQWELEDCGAVSSRPSGTEAAASAGRFVTLRAGDDPLCLPARPRPPALTYADGLRWLIRAKGAASLEATTMTNDAPCGAVRLNVDASRWTWFAAPLPAFAGYQTVRLDLTAVEGAVDLDSAILTQGHWAAPPVGASIRLPAPVFFHAGYTDLAADTVVLRPEWDPRESFYGPGLPLDPGRYRVHIEMGDASPAEGGTGAFSIRLGPKEVGRFVVGPGRPNDAVFDAAVNLPWSLHLEYDRNAGMRLRAVVLQRLAVAD